MVSPRLVIDSPTTFIPAPYGLLSVMQTPPGSDGTHWKNGVTYTTTCLSAGGSTYDECISSVTGSPPPPPASKTDNVELEFRGATPVTVYAEFDCSPVGIADAAKIADAALAQTGGWQLERAFWTGLINGVKVVYPHLADTTETLDANGILMQTVPVTGTATDVVCGLGFLEEYIGNCYNGAGVIHVPRKVLPALMASSLVEARGATLYTKNGNLVAVGSGYPGSSPAGVAATQCTSWIYATGAVFGYAGPVRIFPHRDSIDRAENTVKMIAERTYVVGWDCCHAAVSVDLTLPASP